MGFRGIAHKILTLQSVNFSAFWSAEDSPFSFRDIKVGLCAVVTQETSGRNASKTSCDTAIGHSVSDDDDE